MKVISAAQNKGKEDFKPIFMLVVKLQQFKVGIVNGWV